MSHTLHRLGNPEDLAGDWVVFAMSAKGINEDGSAEKLRRFLDIALAHDPINYGDMKTGNSFTAAVEDLFEGIQDVSIVHAVFTSEDEVAAVLCDLKAADLGMSVVVSGLVDATKRCAERAGLRQHTVEYSLGIWGQMDRLPGGHTLEITTMCGHGMVSAGLVEELAKQVRRGKLTVEEAAHALAKPCVCGVFNQQRAARLLAALVAGEDEDTRLAPGKTVVGP
jgi:hypothetical protein